MARKKRLSGDMKTFDSIYQLVPDDRKLIAENLIREIVFMAKALEELRETIAKTGPVELFEQGKQKFMRENPALKSYNTTIQRYNQTYKQLTDLLPRQIKEAAENALQKFLKQG